MENCYIHDNDNIDTHGDGIQWYRGNNVTLRYNVFENNGQMLMLTVTAWGNEYVNELRVYYNIFRNRGGAHYNGISKNTLRRNRASIGTSTTTRLIYRRRHTQEPGRTRSSAERVRAPPCSSRTMRSSIREPTR